MFGLRRRTLPSLLIATFALSASLSACGGSDDSRLLSQTRASKLRATLNLVEQRADQGDCAGADEQATAFQQEVTSLSPRLDTHLRDALADGASRLRSLVTARCQAPAATPAPAAPEPQQAPKEEPKTEKKPEKPAKGKGKAKGNEGNGGEDGTTTPTPKSGGDTTTTTPGSGGDTSGGTGP